MAHASKRVDDPFIKLMNSRLNSTTTTPKREIDYVLLFGID
jgi:hypothetical protein